MLDEISGKLSDLLELFQKRVPYGRIFSIGLTATTKAQKIVLTFSATVYNDGASAIYIMETDRTISSSDQPLKSGESVNIDHKERGQYTHWIATLSGTAIVRIFALD